MSTTVTNYLMRINKDFPVRGQDNDSQGFRDNWKNIYEAVKNVNDEVDQLNLFSIKTNNTATFYGNTIEDFNAKNDSIELYDLGLQSSGVEVDYTKGSYQKIEVTPGDHTLTVNNWPGEGKSGRVRLVITVSATSAASISFNPAYINTNPQSNPFDLQLDKPNIFDLWSENGGERVFIQYYTAFTYNTSSTSSILWANQLKLGALNNNSESNRYYTGTNRSTIVQHGNRLAEIGLVPNRVRKRLLEAIDKTTTVPIELIFDTASDILPGATFYTSITNTRYEVVSVTTNSVFISPSDFNVSDLILEDRITFTNPTFNDQPRLMTLATNAANTATGVKFNYKGSIYADRTKLEVTYDDFDNNNTNTFVISKIQTSTNTSYYNTDVVDSMFIHNLLPVGTIIMWYGKASDVPYGWTICDGKQWSPTIINGIEGPVIRVPDLSNKFIVGATADIYDQGDFVGPGSTINTTTATMYGGSADSIVVNHAHEALFEGEELDPHSHNINDPKHTHANGSYGHVLLPPVQGAITGSDTTNSPTEANVTTSQSMIEKETGITIISTSSGTPAGLVTVKHTGETGVGKNVPPFAALYYIMKISGAASTNPGIQ